MSRPTRPCSKRAFCIAKSRSASCRRSSESLTLACTSESDCAWLTSGSISASTSPCFTIAPSRTLRVDARAPRPRTCTSTLVTGSTTPTSRTETWRSSAWTLPEPEGGAVGLGVGLFAALGLHVGGPRHGRQDHRESRSTSSFSRENSLIAENSSHVLFIRIRAGECSKDLPPTVPSPPGVRTKSSALFGRKALARRSQRDQ